MSGVDRMPLRFSTFPSCSIGKENLMATVYNQYPSTLLHLHFNVWEQKCKEKEEWMDCMYLCNMKSGHVLGSPGLEFYRRQFLFCFKMSSEFVPKTSPTCWVKRKEIQECRPLGTRHLLFPSSFSPHVGRYDTAFIVFYLPSVSLAVERATLR